METPIVGSFTQPAVGGAVKPGPLSAARWGDERSVLRRSTTFDWRSSNVLSSTSGSWPAKNRGQGEGRDDNEPKESLTTWVGRDAPQRWDLLPEGLAPTGGKRCKLVSGAVLSCWWLLSSQNCSRLPFLAEERGKRFRDSNLTGFWNCFEILASVLKIAGKSMGWGSTCRYEVRLFLPPLTGVIEPRTKIVLDIVKSSKLCSILNAQRVQACAMRFW